MAHEQYITYVVNVYSVQCLQLWEGLTSHWAEALHCVALPQQSSSTKVVKAVKHIKQGGL